MPKFTEANVAAIVTRTKVRRGKRDVIIFDDAMPAFFVRVFESGKASFGVQFRVGHQQRRMSLGPVVPRALAEARRLAHEALAKARLGQDVQADKKAAAAKQRINLGVLIPRYIAARRGELRARTLSETERYLNGPWRPLHDMAIDAIGREDIVKVLNEFENSRGATSADRAKAALGGLYAWALDRYCQINPTLGIRGRSKNGARTRTLSATELVGVWNACLDDDFGRIVKLLILTGQRRNEIGDLSWAEINTTAKQIDLPEERTKNRKPHIVPLSQQARAVLKVVERWEGRAHLFGWGETRGYQGWSKSKDEMDARITAARKQLGTKDAMPTWTLHDLRRSFATLMSEKRIASRDVVELILNHVSGTRGGVAGVYDRSLLLDERRRALSMWGETVEALVQGRTARVVPIQKVS